MKVRVERATSLDLILQMEQTNLRSDEKEIFNSCLRSSANLWGGFVGEELACIFGLIPPTLLSNEAYLWLHTTPALKSHEFVFIRYSQRFIGKVLEQYPTITGVTLVDNTKAIRWLKWLGAEFREESQGVLPFTIRAK